MLISTRILILPFYLLFVTGLLLPSNGSHGLLSPKSLIFLSASLCVFTIILIKQKIQRSHLSLGIFLCFYLTFLTVWLLIGIAHPLTKIAASIDQTKLFLITLSVPLMTTYLYLERMINPRNLLRLVIFSNFTYCISKLTLIFLHFIGALNIWSILYETGFHLQSMSIFGGLQRLQTSVDISTPFIFMFALYSDRLEIRITPHTRKIYLLAAIISNLFTFSRFLLFIQATAFFLYIFSLKARQLLKTLGLALCLIMLGITLIGPNNLYKSVEHRFFSYANYRSDQTRVEQIDAMLDYYVDSPYIGAGLGAHAPKVIRDQIQLHSYEVQWMAFLMQFGLFGVLFLLFVLFIIALPLLKPPLSRSSLGFLCLYFLWVISGFTNPFLISLQSGIIYTLFLTAGWLLSPSLIKKLQY